MVDWSPQLNNFPLGVYADTAQKKAQLEQQQQEINNRDLQNTISNIGTAANSLVQKRMQVAQALAQAKIYAQANPSVLSPTVTSDTQQMPVASNQTAQGTDDAGNILPSPIQNAPGQGALTSRPQTTTTSTPSPVTMQNLQSAFMGEKPGDLIRNLFERQQEARKAAFEQQKLGVESGLKSQQIIQTGELAKALTGVKGQEVNNKRAEDLRSSIRNEEQTQAQYLKDFPELTGTFISGLLPEGSNAKESAAFDAYRKSKARVDEYNKQLYSGSSGGNSTGVRPNVTISLPGWN